ncbi:hypothetical protein PT974_11290 [Cladobotryum mycophilum]|uniref:MARVEL domain-containing protein n=1 Tax=Cladobotryum mycophilum TaxID=491253 RepID=A0ABR0S4U4_9HYPO
MALARVVSLILRAAELVFAAIVAGVTGDYLHKFHHASSWSLGRFIYTEVIAALSIFLALIWLIPFAWSLVHWPVDIVISICWWVAFGLLVNWSHGSCGRTFDWGNVSPWGNFCGRFKANEAFAFLSAVLWLVSALVGIFWVSRHERRTRVDGARPGRRGWYGRSQV